MENWDTRLFQTMAKHTNVAVENLQEQTPTISSFSQNVVELESQRELRRKANEIIQHCHSHAVTTSELRQQLQACATTFGSRFSLHLARSLQEQHHNQTDRQAIVWLLTLLNDKAAIPLLQHIANQQQLTRAIRLSASLALAGMSATLPSGNAVQVSCTTRDI
jgi:hypothetical protein